jgi:undecaprenyl-diphosphatase
MYKFLQLLTDKDAGGTVSATILGIIVAFVVGILVIKWFLDYLKKHTLLAFVVYRVVLGLTVISIWLIRSL